MNESLTQPPLSETSAESKLQVEADHNSSLIFALYAESDEELLHAWFLVESVRAFAGTFRHAPIWVYLPEKFTATDTTLLQKFASLEVEIRTTQAPADALRFYYAGKVYAAAKAEAETDGKAAVLVWLDEDTIVLREPVDFMLNDNISFAYRPVMHNRSGSLFANLPDPFWSRIYEKLSINSDLLFPMVTPADRQTIRAYFNAGLLIVRPERRILRGWAESFAILYNDSLLVEMCDNDITKKIFLHQTALVGAVVNQLKRDEMIELSEEYNYPIFFHQQFDAEREFGSIDDVTTLRYDVYFRNPDPEWSAKLKGPEQMLSWLRERLGKN